MVEHNNFTTQNIQLFTSDGETFLNKQWEGTPRRTIKMGRAI